MSIRTERVSAQLKADLGQILQQDYQHQAMLTVTAVRISPDLMSARVYLSILPGQGEQEEIFRYIQEKTPEIRKKLAARVRHQLRRVPEIHFHLDDTANYVEKMDSLFRKIESQRKSKQEDDGRKQSDSPDDLSATGDDPEQR